MRPQDRFGQAKKDPASGQKDIYNQISAQPSQEDFSTFETDNANRRNELLKRQKASLDRQSSWLKD